MIGRRRQERFARVRRGADQTRSAPWEPVRTRTCRRASESRLETVFGSTPCCDAIHPTGISSAQELRYMRRSRGGSSLSARAIAWSRLSCSSLACASAPVAGSRSGRTVLDRARILLRASIAISRVVRESSGIQLPLVATSRSWRTHTRSNASWTTSSGSTPSAPPGPSIRAAIRAKVARTVGETKSASGDLL